jgi:O-6-methylguanine DNA methyltransferase
VDLRRLIDSLDATDFQKKVWRAALSIPRGETRSYAWIARRIGRPKAYRAVGNALNRNPLAPAVPCHRVTRKDGGIGGFARGIAMKRLLLKIEGRVL